MILKWITQHNTPMRNVLLIHEITRTQSPIFLSKQPNKCIMCTVDTQQIFRCIIIPISASLNYHSRVSVSSISIITPQKKHKKNSQLELGVALNPPSKTRSYVLLWVNKHKLKHMALEVEWYDFVCFGIVGVALIGAFWVLWMNEAISRRQYDSMYASLLLARPDHEVVANLLPKSHVNASQLWTSCWPNVHPLILFATRFTSFLIMAILLAWDVVDYDASIFYYYTEYIIIYIYICLFNILLHLVFSNDIKLLNLSF